MSYELKESAEDYVNNVMFQSIISENMDCTNVVENSEVNSENDNILLNFDRRSSENAQKFPCSDPGQNVGKMSRCRERTALTIARRPNFHQFQILKNPLIDHVVQGRNFK